MKRHENILILGLGGVGLYLAQRLSRSEHAVTVIEADPALIKRADGEVDARLVRGDAMCFECWRQAEADKMDYLIAVTDKDAVNIVASQIADRCGIPQKIARIRSLEVWEPDALLTPRDLSIDLVIRPEELTAQEIARLVRMRGGGIVIDVGRGEMQVMATRVGHDSPLAGLGIKDIALEYDDIAFRIVAIARDIETIIPSGDDVVQQGDHVFILAHSSDLAALTRQVGAADAPSHRVMIVGGGLIGARTAALLERSFRVRLIEADESRAEELSYLLSRTECLHGDGSEAATLIEAGLLETDTIVTATGDNETNIMTSVLARHLIKRQGDGRRGKTIALVNREGYLALASSIGADVALNMKVIAANQILKHLRRRNLLSVAHLHGCDAEVVELVADPNAPITKKPLSDQHRLKGLVLIGGVCRDGQWQIAVGSTQIRPGDNVVSICASDNLGLLRKLFVS